MEPSAPPSVLVVDDHPFLRDTIRRLLEMDGLRVVQAADGAECLRLAVAERPALILLDLSMPGVDGLEAMSRLRSDPATAAIPVVCISARPEEELRALGFQHSISKPFRAADLRARVVALVGQM